MVDRSSIIKFMRVAFACGSSVSAFIAPLIKSYDFLSPRFLKWTGTTPRPDKLSILANLLWDAVFGILIWAVESFAICFSLTLVSVLLGKVYSRGEKLLDKFLPVLCCIAILIVAGCLINFLRISGPVPVIPFKDLGLFRITMAIIGFQAYFFAFSWLATNVLEKSPFTTGRSEPDLFFYVSAPTKILLLVLPFWFIVLGIMLLLLSALLWRTDFAEWIILCSQVATSAAIIIHLISLSFFKVRKS